MKKSIILIVLTMLSGIASAQITTYPGGNVNIQRSTEYPMNILSVGEESTPNVYSSYRNGVHSKVTNYYDKYNIGLYGDASRASNLGSGRAVGVLGTAGYSTDGYNYGVMGRVSGSQNGAGVYGSVYNNMGSFVNGRYAGFYDGPVYVLGNLKVMGDIITPSDIRLKENVVPLSDTEMGSTLENVLGMNVLEYNYKQPQTPEAEKDTLKTEDKLDDNSTKRHFGLSAQELQAIYPNLVKEGQDGYLGVNYVELVPILIRSIQELNQKIESMESRELAQLGTSDIKNETLRTKAMLYQNTPSPFNSQTIIRYTLPDNTQDAYIFIFDMQGVLKKQLPLIPSNNSVTINAYDLTPGIYLYSLIVSGQEVATKRMIISK